jgi:hypothetical protein
MRDYLKRVADEGYWVYGITEDDFAYTVDLIQQVVDLRTEKHQAYVEEVRQRDPECADDILDDVAYYKYVDEQHLWQHALVRLQGLIEAVMTNEFANLSEGVQLFGLASKIRAVTAEGYSISEGEKSELLSWGKLRNAFAHAPPEQYRPVLRKEDVTEYQEFVLTLYRRWKGEKEAKYAPA